ncbi:histidine phosphatase family protein [Desmonostoc muscorum LEGE 12446]|uniref:Histidine phosphatase family protein n=1 Tax=Desmonostoc muscorum LEGE 12446 TaxID=1828758 RepID=A0A8J6ZTJ9_DESMC|nr:histidine phosphatase family protein [Desmonostoc muscorum]MCF2145604.1 histidine phosphatase family protein [Desmonostoc muscorum LEGE 12446]
MQRLILVKHSLPEKIESIPAREWALSSEGRQRSHFLADKLADFQPGIIAASTEPKAIETAQIIAQKFNQQVEIVEGLQECVGVARRRHRTNFGFVEEKKFFETLEAFFATLDKLVMGLETATQANQRFQQAVENIIAKTPHDDVMIVAHGTVMTLFVAGCTGIEPFQFWRQLGQPMAIVLLLPDFNSLEIITLNSDKL